MLLIGLVAEPLQIVGRGFAELNQLLGQHLILWVYQILLLLDGIHELHLKWLLLSGSHRLLKLGLALSVLVEHGLFVLVVPAVLVEGLLAHVLALHRLTLVRLLAERLLLLLALRVIHLALLVGLIPVELSHLLLVGLLVVAAPSLLLLRLRRLLLRL